MQFQTFTIFTVSFFSVDSFVICVLPYSHTFTVGIAALYTQTNSQFQTPTQCWIFDVKLARFVFSLHFLRWISSLTVYFYVFQRFHCIRLTFEWAHKKLKSNFNNKSKCGQIVPFNLIFPNFRILFLKDFYFRTESIIFVVLELIEFLLIRFILFWIQQNINENEENKLKWIHQDLTICCCTQRKMNTNWRKKIPKWWSLKR